MKWSEGDAMDNLFDKMGLYDFFGILIPGMFFLGAMIVIDLPILDVFYVPDSGTVFVILFIVFSYIFGRFLGFGVFGVWMAMILDWWVRAAFFVWRYRGGAWKTKALV